MISVPSFIPPGYRLIRELSCRSRSWVFLAINPQERWCCLKIQQAVEPRSLEALIQWRERLASKGAIPGLIATLALGAHGPSGSLWEEMPLSDDAVQGRPFDPKLQAEYVPMTLALRLLNEGRGSTLEVIGWGRRLAAVLERVHGLGLQHRDVKPSNILFFDGKPVLGDLGSVGIDGKEVEFPGTEGYMPPDGRGSAALDVFALGRALYEVWTGCDRFQFPSLPSEVVEASDWKSHGWRLNQVLLKASDPRPSRRVSTAAGLLTELDWAAQGGRQWSRRTFLQIGLGVGGLVGMAYIWRNLPRYRAVWQKLPPERFGSETWVGSEQTCDWNRRELYSLYGNERLGSVFQTVSLRTWERDSVEQKGIPLVGPGVRDPVGGWVWGSASVTGEIVRIHRDHPRFEVVSTRPLNQIRFTGPNYWNVVTNRLGRFSGYGEFQTEISRWEWNPLNRGWEPIGEAGPRPIPRMIGINFPGRDWKRWFIFGGSGNRTGLQGKQDPDLREFDGNWHRLDDLWELDLETQKWTQRIPLNAWNPQSILRGVYHPVLDATVFLQGTPANTRQPAALWLHENLSEGIPHRAFNGSGAAAVFNCWSLLAEPELPSVLIFANVGVFRVTLSRV